MAQNIQELAELPPLDGPGSNANDFMKWLNQRPEDEIEQSAQMLFAELVRAASQPRNSTKDACVKLCGFVQLCVKSERANLRHWAFQESTSTELFNYYLEWNEKDQHRSMRLVLDLLSTLILQNPYDKVREMLKTDFLSKLVTIIARRSSRPVVKSCMSSLTHFLIKSVFTIDDVLREYTNLRADLADRPVVERWQAFVDGVFEWMEYHYVCPVAGKFAVTIFSALDSSPKKSDFSVQILRSWLEAALSANPDIFESIKNYVLAPLFKTNRHLSITLLEELNKVRAEDDAADVGSEVAALLQLAALEVGKKSAMVDDPSPEGAQQPANVVILDREILERFLGHSSAEVRSFAMSLLVTSSSTTKPYSPVAFELLKHYLRPYHADPDSKFRNEILSHTKNMVKRAQGAVSVLRKDIGRLGMKAFKADTNGKPVNTHISQGAKQIANAGEPWLRESLQVHEDFFAWYLEFLRHELVPTASYQRHITALKSLSNIVKLEKETQSAAIERIYGDPQWLRAILDLIMDPFDDVRDTASGLLMLFPAESLQKEFAYGSAHAGPEQPSTTPLETLKEFCARASKLASRTSRADHSDGTARSHGVLCAWQDTLGQRLVLLSHSLDELERKVSMAERDLGNAVMSEPVHGAFAAIRYAWDVLSQSRYTDEELQELAEHQSRIVDLSRRIWKAVSYVLCDDSPEGHIPEELDEIEGLDTKGLLSYSFRATHEASNLLRTIVANLRLKRRAGHLLPTPETFRAIGDLAFSQLSTLRHRGAFSSVSLTFTCCCQHAKDVKVVALADERPLLESWYEGTLTCIHTQRSTTRRSAGIPALMAGILASNAVNPSFQEVMGTLQHIAAIPAQVSETDGSNLPQVHAFNCLKEIFKSSLLSKNAELYLPECLQLATDSLKSEVWAIRNCALLLLRSLIDNLFGTSESKSLVETGWDGKTLRLSYTKYSSLPPILLNLLQSGERAMEPSTLTQSSAAESVFPALEIIRRAGPPESHREELYGLITKYLGSRQWHIREIAARTLCSFLLNEHWIKRIRELLERASGSANRLHGTLLTVKFFLERTLLEMKDKQFLDGTQQLDSILQACERPALRSSETAAAYIETRNILAEVRQAEDNKVHASRLLKEVDEHHEHKRHKTAALLDHRAGMMGLYQAAAAKDLQSLMSWLFNALKGDVDTACALLEATPTVWGDTQTTAICDLYLEVCQRTKVPQARAVALTNLAELMDKCIAEGRMKELPSTEHLDSLDRSLVGNISPTLANAILLVSGPAMAIHTLKHHGQMSFFTFEQRLRSWGKAIAEALDDDNTFDTRMAAAQSLQSFATALRSAVGSDAAYLPVLLALYKTLIDDDEEIREVGAMAAAFVMAQNDEKPQQLVAVDAADALLRWAQEHFGQTNEFRAYIACRLVGDPLIAIDIGVQDLAAWTDPEEQFKEALHVDESLFAVEEQNLFIDEVRETERWALLFEQLQRDYDEIEGEDGESRKVLIMDTSLSALRAWTEVALGVLAEQVAKDDGPLGWASNPNAFALCYRVLVCARVLTEVLGHADQTIAGPLQRICEAGRSSRLHGLLLSALANPPAAS